MKIEEMYGYYQNRHNTLTKELKRRMDEVVTLFREAVDRIPEEMIYQAIAFDRANAGGKMRFYVSINNNAAEYVLGDIGITGKVQMQVQPVHQLEDFIQREYNCNVYVSRFEWKVEDSECETILVFIANTEENIPIKLLRKKASCLILDLRKVLFEREVEVDVQGKGDQLVINVNLT